MALIEPIQKVTSHKTKGGALYVAIIISIIVAIILGMFILIAGYNQRNANAYAQSVQLNYNLLSAFQLAQSEYFNQSLNNQWLKNTGNDDSIKIQKKYWGAYQLINVQTKNRHKQLKQCGLYGTNMSGDTGLVVSDNSRPIGLSGKIEFKAACYLPRAGIKPAYIEGQSYQPSSETNSFIKSAPAQIPYPAQVHVDGMANQRITANDGTDSLVSNLPMVIDHSFTQKTLVWECGLSKLSQLRLKNNIKLICNQIEIDSTCHFENILIVANKVRFNQGFVGKVHVIARDSILIQDNCHFNFPSSFVLLPKEEGENTFNTITIGNNCVFFGGIVALGNKENTSSQKVFIKLNASSTINGFVYSSDYLHLQGEANANIMASKLLLKTPSAVYENHLLGCTIHPKKYSSVLAIPFLFQKDTHYLLCQKLN
ncbi:MAG: hypothetical protein IT236_04475 [Bacteroidia bacterium]|nr:hypothetical protein [Bacteroidia bacterium]